jgi:glycosyltransferase involved in cell wall biosynthesis
MKILQIHTRYRQEGGEDRVAQAEAELLRNAGHSVVQFCVENPHHPVKSAAGLALSAWNPSALRAVRSLVREHKPEIAHVHNTWYRLSPSVLSGLRIEGIPVVMTLHNFRLLCANGLLFRDGRICQDCVGTHPWHGVRHQCYRDSVIASSAAAFNIAAHQRRGTWETEVDEYLALTSFARDRFVDGGLPREKIRIKPNFTADPGPRAVSPDASESVLFVGRLSPEKGIEQLIRAWNEADTARLRLLVVGDGPLRTRAIRLAGPGIDFLGFRQPAEVRRLMLKARALVFPSQWYEMFALTLVEAMAAGLPIVANDVGGVSEVVGDAVFGLLTSDDRAGWVAALQRLAGDEGLAETGRHARACYEHRYSEIAALEMLESAYTWALEQVGRTGGLEEAP